MQLLFDRSNLICSALWMRCYALIASISTRAREIAAIRSTWALGGPFAGVHDVNCPKSSSLEQDLVVVRSHLLLRLRV